MIGSLRIHAVRITLLLFAACSAAPSRNALWVRDRFPLEYTGRIAPLSEPSVIDDLDAISVSHVGGDAWRCRATIVEMPTAGARDPLLLSVPANHHGFTPSLLGGIVDATQLQDLLQAQGDRVRRTGMPVGVSAQGASVLWFPEVHRFLHDFEVEIASGEATASPVYTGFLCGQRLECTREVVAGEDTLAFVWCVDAPAAFGSSHWIPFEPQLARHCLRGRAQLRVGRAVVVGAMPGCDAQHVRFLCIERLP